MLKERWEHLGGGQNKSQGLGDVRHSSVYSEGRDVLEGQAWRTKREENHLGSRGKSPERRSRD